MRRRFLALLTITFSTLACGTFGIGVSPVPPTAAETQLALTTPQPNTSAGADNLLTNPLPTGGRLAVQGIDGNLYVIEAGKAPLALSTDGSLPDQNGHGRLYGHPTWSPQGWLSYVRDDTTGSGPASMDLLAVPPDFAAPLTILSQPDDNYIYGYWSPAPCASGESCGRFAFLLGSGSQIALHLAEVTHDKVTVEDAVGLASPFYFSWSPDGMDMLWHRNVTDLTIYDVENRQIGERLPDTGGTFQSPAWAPDGDRLLFARVEHDANQITIAQDTQRSNVGNPAGSPVFFDWSPDGSWVASASGEYPLSDLTLTRADGTSSSVVNGLDTIVSFFWSPDSTQLAVVTAESKDQKLPQASTSTRLARTANQDTSDVQLVWSLVNVTSGEVTRLGTFFPTPEEFYILQYFDQYSQSHRVWSPDGRYLAYAELHTPNTAPVISLLDTLAPGKDPLVVMQGVQAVYDFGK